MIQFAERVEEVTDILRGDFGVQDMQAAEIVLACSLPCDLPYPWLVLEIPFYRTVAEDAWFALIGQPEFQSLPVIRSMRPRAANNLIKGWLQDRDQPRLFVESHWELPMLPHHLMRMYPYLLQECVKLRTTQPKVKMVTEAAALKLADAVKRVRDARWRDDLPKRAEHPPSLGYYAEMLQDLAPDVREWEVLMQNLTALAMRRAYLFNRRVDSTDWAAVSRVMRDTVPPWVADIAMHFDRGRFRSLRGVYKDKLIKETMTRLLGRGILQQHKGQWLLRDKDGRGADVIGLLKAPIF